MIGTRMNGLMRAIALGIVGLIALAGGSMAQSDLADAAEEQTTEMQAFIDSLVERAPELAQTLADVCVAKGLDVSGPGCAYPAADEALLSAVGLPADFSGWSIGDPIADLVQPGRDKRLPDGLEVVDVSWGVDPSLDSWNTLPSEDAIIGDGWDASSNDHLWVVLALDEKMEELPLIVISTYADGGGPLQVRSAGVHEPDGPGNSFFAMFERENQKGKGVTRGLVHSSGTGADAVAWAIDEPPAITFVIDPDQMGSSFHVEMMSTGKDGARLETVDAPGIEDLMLPLDGQLAQGIFNVSATFDQGKKNTSVTIEVCSPVVPLLAGSSATVTAHQGNTGKLTKKKSLEPNVEGNHMSIAFKTKNGQQGISDVSFMPGDTGLNPQAAEAFGGEVANALQDVGARGKLLINKTYTAGTEGCPLDDLINDPT